MKFSAKITGLFQSIGLTLYVGTFAFSANRIQQWVTAQHIPPHPVISIILFLLAFVTSALICGSIIFLYPVWLFFEGEKKNALKIIFWSGLWLIVFFVVFGLVGLLKFR